MNWKRIPGYSRYEVSDEGRVRRADRVGTWLPGPCSIWTTSNGYQMTDLTSDAGVNKSIGVHRLVMLAFVGPSKKGEQVRHGDGTRTNNNLSNLSYGTPSQNAMDKVLHGTHRQGEAISTHTLTAAVVPLVVAALDAGGTYAEIGARFGVSKHCVGALARGESWRHITGGKDRRNGSKFSFHGGLAAKEKRRIERMAT